MDSTMEFLPSSVIPTQVLVVCYCHGKYLGYILRLDDSPVGRRIVPNFIIQPESFRAPAFAVVRSKLYVFDGGSITDIESDSPPSTVLYTFPVESNASLVELDKSTAEKGPSMHQPKEYPFATPAPDGRSIIVYSSIVRSSDPCPVELFSISRQKWVKLPPVPLPKWTDDVRIMSLSFAADNLVVLFIEEFGFLKLDLNLGGKGARWKWDKRKFYKDIYDIRLEPCLTVSEDLCLTSSYAMELTFSDLDDVAHTFPYPEFRFPTDIYKYSSLVPYVTQLPPRCPGKDFRFCTLLLGVEEDKGTFHLLLDSYGCELDECSKGLREFWKIREEEWRLYKEEKEAGSIDDRCHGPRFSVEPPLPGASRELSASFYCDTPVLDLSWLGCLCFAFIPPN